MILDRRSFVVFERRPLQLLLAVVLLRGAGLVYGVVDIDETDWVTYAQMIRRGALFYVDIVEKKPPLGYFLYALLSPLGFRMWPMQLLAMGWVFATSLVIGRAAREWTGREDVGWAAAWICAFASACNVFSVNGEMMLNLPVAVALLCWVRASRGGGLRWDLLAGMAIGIAAAFKHQGGIALAAFGIALLVQLAIVRGIVMGLGFALPWALLVGAWAATGHLDAFVEWNVMRNFFYAAKSAGAGSGLQRAAEGITLFVVLAAPLYWALAIRATLRRELLPAPGRLGVLLLLWLSFVPVALGARFYGHYFLQLVPGLAIVAAPLFERRKLFTALAIAPLILFQAIGLGRYLAGDFPCQDKKTVELSAWLHENTKPEERIFVWGHYTPIFYLAERLPGTRYANTSVHMGDFDPAHLAPGTDLTPFHSQRDIRATLEDLEKNKPSLVVDTAPADIHQWSKIPLESFPEISAYVNAHYSLVAHAGGAAIYRLR